MSRKNNQAFYIILELHFSDEFNGSNYYCNEITSGHDI